jgi:hypothetical protein
MVVAITCRSGGLGPALPANLSPGGFRLEQVREEVDPKSLSLHIPGAEPLTARVVWSRGTVLGCQFDTPLAD